MTTQPLADLQAKLDAALAAANVFRDTISTLRDDYAAAEKKAGAADTYDSWMVAYQRGALHAFTVAANQLKPVLACLEDREVANAEPADQI